MKAPRGSEILSVTFASQISLPKHDLSYESKLSQKISPVRMLSKLFGKLVMHERAQGGCLGTKSR